MDDAKVLSVEDLIPKLKLSTPSVLPKAATATPTTFPFFSFIIGPPLFPWFKAASV